VAIVSLSLRRFARSPLAFGAIGLAALLALLAVLQYRWVGELSGAELERLRAGAQARAFEFAHQFDREITRAFVWFAATGRVEDRDWSALLAAAERWNKSAPHPRLIKDVYVLAAAKDKPPETLRLNVPAGQVEAAPWPEELAPLLARLSRDLASGRVGRERFGPRPDGVEEGLPALVLPLLDPDPAQENAPARRSASWRPMGFVVLRLDTAYIHDEYLPELERRYFDPATGFDYGLEVFTGREAQKAFYVSADLPAHPEPPDAAVDILSVRFDPQNQDLFAGTPLMDRVGRRLLSGQPRPSYEGRRGPPPQRSGGFRGEGRWRVLLWNRAGGLEEVVTAARHRNLAVSFGVLLLLGTSVGLLLAAAARAQRLARQQIEFVAGVTHELRTPLAVIRSAGENLADGLVADVGQVRSYGALVRDEGRRLSEMVEQVLELAGAESGRTPASAQALQLGSLIGEVLAEGAPARQAAAVTIESHVPESLPPVSGDPAALRRALRNLLDNALKYRGESSWIGIRAGVQEGRRGREVWVSVEDQGLGIAPQDLPHVFDPFYRGGDALERQIHGSGLGLSLVRRIAESHGGRVAVESRRGGGSVFTLSLPALAEAPAPLAGPAPEPTRTP
jgi:signal transduction histidine kinase